MNPQYMQQQQSQQQQQPPYFSGPQSSPYGKLNSNVPPPKGPLLNSQTYASQKSMQGPPSLHPQPQYYTNNLPQANAQHASPTSSPHLVSPSSQGNLVNQMSNMNLGNLQGPPPAQNYPPAPPGKSSPVIPNAANVNGFNSSIDAMSAGTAHLGQADPGGKTTLISGQDARASQQNVSQAASLPFSAPTTTGISHFPGQTIPTSEHGFSAGLSSPNQQSEQTNITEPSIGQMNLPRPQMGQQMPPLSQAQTLSNSPLPPSSQGNSLSGPPLHGPPRQNLPEAGQNAIRPPLVGPNSGPPLSGQNLTGPPLPGPNVSGPPLPGQNLADQRQSASRPPLVGLNSGPPLPGQNLSGLPLSGQNLSGPPLPGQNLSRPPLVGQNLSGPTVPAQNITGPPLPGQQYLGQQKPNYYPDSSNMPPLHGPPLAGQQNLAGQNYNRSPLPGSQPHMLPGQAQTMPPGAQPGQRQYSSAPPMPGQMASPMGMNRTMAGPGYQQGYQGYHNQGDMYSTQRSPYEADAPEYQQTRRIDAKLMPSPIQVIEDDQYVRGGVFVTNERGLVPPLVTTKFVTQDEGNASPRYIRSTMYTVPTTADITKQSNVPFSLILSPMARIVEGEYEPPIVDMGEIGPVRCVRCKAYMSPFMQFIDAGRRFQCMLCKATTEVPAEYFQHLDHTGQRMDRYERPELMLGTYEYLATKDYCRNNTFPKPPAVVFVIDVSYNTVKSGLVNLLCMKMKSIIRNLPIDAGQTKTNMKVGFITYNNTVHFYNINSCLAQPQMMIVGDVQDVFMPLLDGFLCDPEESEAVIDSLMAQIPAMFAETRETETVLAPAIQAGLEALKASECAGKLMVFHSSLPIAEAPGKLKNRNDRNLLGTEKEKTVLAPQNNVYNNLGQDCVSVGCSVDLFIFNNSYVDIATIGQICRLTGGEVYKYTYFQADIDGERLVTDLINNISRPIAFDAVMRVRTSTGVRATDFYGHFFMSNTTDMELSSIDCNKALAIEIKHDDKLTDDEGVYVQAALLYTSCAGIRRLRIINLSLKTSSQLADLYRACDLDAIMNYFLKQSVFKLIDSTPNTVKNSLISKCVNILATYRRYCASPSSSAQLILPECMKLLPLYINAVLKSDAISGGADMTIDDRSYIMQVVATMPVSISVVYIYPRLMALHEVDPQDTEIPRMSRCSITGFTDDGAYLLENSVHMFLWLGSALSPQWIQEVFGVSSVVEVDTDRTALPVLDSPLNKRIRDIINRVRAERHRCMRLTIVRQREKLEMVLRHFLIEDKRNDGSQCYVDFICHVHKEIRTLLNLV